MASLPYVTLPGNIKKAFDEIKKAAVPGRVSQDFVKTILKIPGGSGDQMTTFLKKLGMAGVDGAPSERYRKFRNPTSSGAAMAEAVRSAYSPLYVRNEFMHKLSDDELIGLIVEATGQAHDSNPVKLIASCIKQLKTYANFEETLDQHEESGVPATQISDEQNQARMPSQKSVRSIGLSLGYTINLNLPPTSDPAVFDAIFKSLKENLLSEDDG